MGTTGGTATDGPRDFLS